MELQGAFSEAWFFPSSLLGSFAEVASTGQRRLAAAPLCSGTSMSDGSRQVESPFSTSTDSFFHSQQWKIAQSVLVRSWLS